MTATIFSLLLSVGATCVVLAQAPPPVCGNNSKFGVSKRCNIAPCPGVSSFEPYTGNVQRTVRDLELWGSVGGLPMVWNHYYTSRGNILWNYSFVYGMYDGPMVGGQPSIVIDYPEGGQNSFVRNPANANEWLPPAGIDKRLFQSGNDFTLQMANGFRYRFTKFTLIVGPNTYFYYLLQDIKDTKQNLYRLTYTVNRQLDSVIEPAGRFFKIHYTVVGGRRLIGQVSTSDGRSVQYHYDIYNDGVSRWIRFAGATYGDGTHASYGYIQSSPGVALRLGSANDPRYMGAATRMSYTYEWSIAAGYIKEEKNGVTGQVMATLFATDSTRTVCYANGKQEVFHMPPALLGNRKAYTDGLARTTRYGYDMGDQGFLAKDTDALNRVTSYTARTIYGSLLNITYADGSTASWTRDNLDLVKTYTDELGRVTTYTYDGSHRVIRIDYPDASFETFTYNSFGQVLDHRLRNGGTEHMLYNSRGLKTGFDDALGNTTTYSYDASDRLDSVVDARGNITSYQYNERGLTTKMTNADISFQTYAYDAFGNRTGKTDELNHTWSTTYDEFRRSVAETDPLSRVLHYSYDLPGGICGCAHEYSLPTGITLPSGKTTRYAYDVEWQQASRTEGANTADSATASYEYDMVGNLVKMIDPRGKEWTHEYDLRNRKKAAMDPLANRTEWTYDAAGNTLTVKRPDNGSTTNIYDNMDRLTQSTDPKGQVTQYAYDAAGNMVSLTDPKGAVYTNQYDLLNRKTKMVYPGGPFEQYTYDAYGNLAAYTTRAGAIRTYTYDNRNRETLSDWSDATPDVSYTYDAASRLLTLTSSVSAIGHTYNNADELTGETQHTAGSGGGAKTTAYTYNADGLPNTTTYPGGTTLGYSYTGRNQLDSLTDGAGPALVNYNYDLNGNRVSKILTNATVATYAYDDNNQMLTADHRLGLTSFSRYDYGYDNVYRRKFMQRDLGKGDVYSYDAVDQATGVLYDATNPGGVPSAPARTVSYGLDAAGNRTSVTDNAVPTAYSSNTLNQYTSVGGNAHTYNSNGDLASGNGWTYSYDAQSRLTSATNGSAIVTFAYDAFNRCVRRTTNGVALYFYYDGWEMIEEKDAADVLKQRYVPGGMTDEPLSKTSGSGSVYYHQDALGNVIRLTNAAGSVVEQYSYDAFGAPTIRNGSGAMIATTAFDNRFMFTGREYIHELELYDYRHRMYDAELGRFLQTDPIGFHAGDINLYRYVENNPIAYCDPMGLKWSWAQFWGWGMGGAAGGAVAGAGGGAVVVPIIGSVPGYAVGATGGFIAGAGGYALSELFESEWFNEILPSLAAPVRGDLPVPARPRKRLPPLPGMMDKINRMGRPDRVAAEDLPVNPLWKELEEAALREERLNRELKEALKELEENHKRRLFEEVLKGKPPTKFEKGGPGDVWRHMENEKKAQEKLKQINKPIRCY